MALGLGLGNGTFIYAVLTSTSITMRESVLHNTVRNSRTF
jgi:hypothetical protein